MQINFTERKKIYLGKDLKRTVAHLKHCLGHGRHLPWDKHRGSDGMVLISGLAEVGPG